MALFQWGKIQSHFWVSCGSLNLSQYNRVPQTFSYPLVHRLSTILNLVRNSRVLVQNVLLKTQKQSGIYFTADYHIISLFAGKLFFTLTKTIYYIISCTMSTLLLSVSYVMTVHSRGSSPDSSVASHGNSDFQCSWKWRFFLFFFHNLSLQVPSLPFCSDLLVIHLILLKQNPTTKTVFGLFFRHYQLELWACESVTC